MCARLAPPNGSETTCSFWQRQPWWQLQKCCPQCFLFAFNLACTHCASWRDINLELICISCSGQCILGHKPAPVATKQYWVMDQREVLVTDQPFSNVLSNTFQECLSLEHWHWHFLNCYGGTWVYWVELTSLYSVTPHCKLQFDQEVERAKAWKQQFLAITALSEISLISKTFKNL